MKVVINKCYGGCNLSDEAWEYLENLCKKLGVNFDSVDLRDDGFRSSPLLIDVVERFGDRANGKYSKLKIVEIPDDVDYVIEEYDGMEWVAEKHRTWA